LDHPLKEFQLADGFSRWGEYGKETGHANSDYGLLNNISHVYSGFRLFSGTGKTYEIASASVKQRSHLFSTFLPTSRLLEHTFDSDFATVFILQFKKFRVPHRRLGVVERGPMQQWHRPNSGPAGPLSISP
jgi:hypothetical protein